MTESSLAPNPLARAYQPRRLRAAAISIAWNLLWLSGFLFSGTANRLALLLPVSAQSPPLWIIPAYVAVFFGLYAILNFPLDLWYGYLHERQFGLVKQGLRAWGRDWLIGVTQQFILFVVGSSLLAVARAVWPANSLLAAAVAVLLLFLCSTWFAPDLLPPGLFQYQHLDPPLASRLQSILPHSISALPPILLFTSPELRDFSGGLMGLGRRQVLLISRPTIELASDSLLRFILLHELGHHRSHHLILSALIAWAYVTLGLIASDAAVAHLTAISFSSPAYIPWLALPLTIWMVAGQPVLAYLGRRLEYWADRFYLDHGGTVEEMQSALRELSARNLARTDTTRRRQSLFESLPTAARRLLAAEAHSRRRGRLSAWGN